MHLPTQRVMTPRIVPTSVYLPPYHPSCDRSVTVVATVPSGFVGHGWSSGNGVICHSFCNYVDCTSAEKNGATNPAYGMSDTDWCGYSSWSGKTAVIGVEVFFPVQVAMPRESPPSCLHATLAQPPHACTTVLMPPSFHKPQDFPTMPPTPPSQPPPSPPPLPPPPPSPPPPLADPSPLFPGTELLNVTQGAALYDLVGPSSLGLWSQCYKAQPSFAARGGVWYSSSQQPEYSACTGLSKALVVLKTRTDHLIGWYSGACQVANGA